MQCQAAQTSQFELGGISSSFFFFRFSRARRESGEEGEEERRPVKKKEKQKKAKKKKKCVKVGKRIRDEVFGIDSHNKNKTKQIPSKGNCGRLVFNFLGAALLLQVLWLDRCQLHWWALWQIVQLFLLALQSLSTAWCSRKGSTRFLSLAVYPVMEVVADASITCYEEKKKKTYSWWRFRLSRFLSIPRTPNLWFHSKYVRK